MAEEASATWVFVRLSRGYHPSESFWPGLFALHRLAWSPARLSLCIPACNHRDEWGKWWFEPLRAYRAQHNAEHGTG